MAQARKKPQFFTPIGVFKYAHLNKADTRYKEEGEYSVTVALDKEDPEVQAFIEKLEALVPDQEEHAAEAFANASAKQKAAWKKPKKGDPITEPNIMPFYEDELDEEGDPTGRVIFKFKTKASFLDQKTGKTVKKVVTLVDGKGQVIPAKKRPLVYAGTEGRIAFGYAFSFIASGADSYMSFYLNQAQITKLVSGGGGSSAFGAVEGSDFDGDELDEYNGDDEDAGGEDQTSGDDGLDDDEIPF